MTVRVEVIALAPDEDGGPVPLTREDLKDVAACKCGEPRCDGGRFGFAPYCHPHAGVTVDYIQATGVIEIVCRDCDRGVVRLAIAERSTRGVH